MTASTLINYVPGSYLNIQDPSALGKFLTAELQKIANTTALLNVQMVAAQAAWTAYTPVITASTGVITTSSAVGSYLVIGKTVHFQVDLTVTTNGTGATSLLFTLPFTSTAKHFELVGRVTVGASIFMVVGNINGPGAPTLGNVRKYDGTYPAVDGTLLTISGTYECV